MVHKTPTLTICPVISFPYAMKHPRVYLLSWTGCQSVSGLPSWMLLVPICTPAGVKYLIQRYNVNEQRSDSRPPTLKSCTLTARPQRPCGWVMVPNHPQYIIPQVVMDWVWTHDHSGEKWVKSQTWLSKRRSVHHKVRCMKLPSNVYWCILFACEHLKFRPTLKILSTLSLYLVTPCLDLMGLFVFPFRTEKEAK